MLAPHVDTKFALMRNLMAGWGQLYNPFLKGTAKVSLKGLRNPFWPLEASAFLYTKTLICEGRCYGKRNLQSFKPK